MQTILHLAAVLIGFCVTIASSMPVADAVIPGVVPPNNLTKINDNDVVVPVIAPSNLTKVHVNNVVLPVTAPSNLTKVHIIDAVIPVVAPNNLTKINDDGGDAGAYTCFGILDAYSGDCANLAAGLAQQNTDYVRTKAHQCVGYNYGNCVAKFCSNNDKNLKIPSSEFADHVSFLTGCSKNAHNGVMAPCSDDSFQGSCAWWQIWLQSNTDLVTQGGGGKRSD
ncbi:hypothetical protein PG993_000507 [Apiospora rasikravindrae]|uniref:Secreted protein n=1 Tax=Apiospora rasikravindrae TaxID=990691 RepID=A0ABR1UB22_9PEZI